jgi:7-cyano-7-deazaguanine synthase
MANKTVLVLHSGGLDSTACLFQAQQLGHRVISLGIDYGQRHQVELLFARRQCDAHNIERHVVAISWQKPKRDIPLGRTVDQIKSGVSSAFLPGRNLLFLSIAAAHAAGVGADEVWTGINAVDFSGYPDCTPAFFERFVEVARAANPDGPTVAAPLLALSKPEIARLARSLGIGPGDTWSCYRPKLSAGGVVPCGDCDACKLHDFAWSAA